jgi:uncharacterized protein YjbI with pentapeptide repeats
MSGDEGTCSFVLNSESVDTFGVDSKYLNEYGAWTCPHESEHEEDYCLFHLPPAEKSDTEVVEAVVETLKSVADSSPSEQTERKLQFLGAQFGDFELANGTLGASIDERLNLSHATFEGTVDWSGTTVEVSTVFLGAVFEGEACLDDAVFEEATTFREATFQHEVSIQDATFNEVSSFRAAQFESNVDFERAEFNGLAKFRAGSFDGDANFAVTEFAGNVDFRRTAFTDTADFGSTTFLRTTAFRGAKFGTYADFRRAEFGDKVNFETVMFDGGADFRQAEFNRQALFDSVSLNRAAFAEADLTDADFSNADLREANLESALLSRATLFGADLRGARLSGALLGDVRVDDSTRFLGHAESDRVPNPHSIKAMRSRPCCVYDPRYESDGQYEDADKAKSVYRALEELARKAARPQLQARCFIRRQDLQKRDYKQAAARADSLETRIIAGARYTRAKVARATLLYGESPWRVIGYSIGIILGFALLFPVGGWMKPDGGTPITYTQIYSDPLELLNAVYYSTLTFTALGFGDFKPIGFGRALTTIETGLGAVLVALLVFILGRRAAR